MMLRDADVDDHAKLPFTPVRNAPPPFVFKGPPDPTLPARMNDVVAWRDGRQQPLGDLEAYLRGSDTTAFLIIQDDRLLYEGYFNGYARDSIQTSLSMAKSITSLLVGIALDEGRVGSVEDSVRRYVPELDAEFDSVTLRHLLRMTSGIERRVPKFLGIDLPWSDDARIYYTDDLREVALGARLAEPPGTRYRYNNYNPPLLGLVLERSTGLPAARYLEEKLWLPLGMEYSASWTVDSERNAFARMESGVNARAIDFAKLGRLVLRGGDWDGRRIVSQAWLEASTRPPQDGVPLQDDGIPERFARAGGFYGYFWWGFERPGGPPDSMAVGRHGQVLYISPAKRAILLRHGRSGFGLLWGETMRQIVDRL
jgi:CubicO group peptidase (beta-lactamase class C family)